MLKYLLSRVAANVPTLLAILIAVFFLISIAPGDPVDAFVPPTATLSAQQKESLRHELGLDRPLPVRFGRWLAQLAQGDLGYRYKDGDRVSAAIARRIVPTLTLALAGLTLGALLGILAGLLAARQAGRGIDHGLSLAAYLAVSCPAFLVGILALYVFALKLGWFPAGGYSTPGHDDWQDIARHLVLPATALSIQFIAILMRYSRAGVMEAMSQDFIRTARAKGLTRNQVVLRHAFPNALIPIITVIGTNFAALLGGAVFIETVFSWPGMGTLFLDGIESRDYPLIMGITLFMALTILAVNTLTDLLYSWIDPRIALR
ncbi:MAG TPA: ABC transporter permease [Herbaspirillum sp.]|uniref:ABC transporter permease n=1 Tax=Herbaspirillum sp. TaxID=1890675 RepID=UPI002D3A77E3|nr:ABC transporter permease [Herbaspirillum sp.]HZG20073.1 ABC transporter permease [Herbaspirillum sp.]